MGSGAQFLSATSLRFMLPNMNSCFIIYPTMFNKNEPRFSLRPQAILLSHEKHDFPWWARAWSDIKNIPKDQMYTARFCSDSNPGWNLLCCSPSCIPWRWQKCHRWWSFLLRTRFGRMFNLEKLRSKTKIRDPGTWSALCRWYCFHFTQRNSPQAPMDRFGIFFGYVLVLKPATLQFALR